MPLMCAGRLLKRWRYVGVYRSDVSICAGAVRVGPLRQQFWAVWDRRTGQLREDTSMRRGETRLAPGLVKIRDHHVTIDLHLEEGVGVEVVAPYAGGYVWTRKQAGVVAHGSVVLEDRIRSIEGPYAFIDDWAGYPPRHTHWLWSAGVGIDAGGRNIAWNLVSGINDSERDSERTVWIDSCPQEVEPVRFASDLSGVVFADGTELWFVREAVRRRRDNLGLVRSDYEQPFGAFSGRLPGGVELREAYGVMERHQAVW